MKRALLALIAVVFGRAAAASPVLEIPLAAMCDSASLIVVGELTASPASTPGSSSIVVSRLIKGSPAATTVTFRWPVDLAFEGTQTRFGVLFLTPETPDGFVAVPILAGGRRLVDYVFQVPTGDLPLEFTYGQEAATLDKVVAELRNAIQGDTDPDNLASAYRALLSLQQPSETVIAQSLSRTEPTHTALALQTAGAGLANAIRDRADDGLAVPSQLSALLCRVVDTEVVVPAGMLLTMSTDQVTRLCAVTALRNIHSAAALTSLATAMNSSDLEVAYAGMMGLSAYAVGEIPGGTGRDTSKVTPNPVLFQQSPSIPAFNESPSPYLDYWRRWWQCEACKLGEASCAQVACLGFVASYDAVYSAEWTCTSPGTNGCTKTLISAQAAAYKPEPPDAPPPPQGLFTAGYVSSYSVTYDANWTCTAGGTNGCRKNRLSYSIASYSPTAPDAPVPPAVLYAYGYVATWSVGGWSGCEPSCGPGTQARAVTASSWKATAPDAAKPASTRACNYGSCTRTCYDYGLYRTWPECYAEWPYCDTRYRDDGAGGLLTCRHGYQ